MKKLVSILLALTLCLGTCLMLTSCGDKTDYTVGICQLMTPNVRPFDFKLLSSASYRNADI